MSGREPWAPSDSEERVAEISKRLKDCRIPAHLAIIPDGNRRWAEASGRPPVEGHRRGFEVAKALSRFCRRIGIHTVTVWAFSTENWKRSADEVVALMSLYEEWVRDLLGEAVEEEVRVVHLGRRVGVPPHSAASARDAGFPDGLPTGLLKAIEDLETKTKEYSKNVINLAINYGGVDEITRAVEAMFESSARSGKSPEGLRVEDFLDTAGQPHPNPDLVWRTSGEMRFSGFMPIQSAYAEFTFTAKHFPELSEEDVAEAVEEYSRRVRRFGG